MSQQVNYAFAPTDNFLEKKRFRINPYGPCLYDECNISVKKEWNCGVILEVK